MIALQNEVIEQYLLLMNNCNLIQGLQFEIVKTTAMHFRENGVDYPFAIELLVEELVERWSFKEDDIEEFKEATIATINDDDEEKMEKLWDMMSSDDKPLVQLVKYILLCEAEWHFVNKQ